MIIAFLELLVDGKAQEKPANVACRDRAWRYDSRDGDRDRDKDREGERERENFISEITLDHPGAVCKLRNLARLIFNIDRILLTLSN